VHLVGRLAAAVDGLRGRHERVLVGIDGPDAAGKTTLADRLAAALDGPVHRVGIDDHLRSAPERYARGDLSPEGCYRDTHDLPGFTAACISGPAGVPVVADGVFLLRPELRDLWTLAVRLRVGEDEVLRRAVLRDAARFGSTAEVERRYRARYLPAQELYRAEADPEARADVLVDVTDLGRPRVLRFP
jgi:uridine kinase